MMAVMGLLAANGNATGLGAPDRGSEICSALPARRLNQLRGSQDRA